ncbi:CHAD domain-containing protein [Dyella sp. 2HG41-7]|uniref:CHAD domain-containing protein n=1 Tax=Dyella sp. 2HG41-7 TaxID=2883239 RepID=UPI001F464F7A|nr:CHAD domain-containing protein [Dyella sp. 2HG41-7]
MNKAKHDSSPKLGPALGSLAAGECRSLQRALAMRKKRHEGIHATRKSCRRLRCLIRFLPAAEPVDALDRVLKELARSFSPLRDAHIAARTARLLATSHKIKLTPNVIKAFDAHSERLLDNALQDDPHWRHRRAEAHRVIAACNSLRWEDIRPSSAKKTLKRTTRKMKKTQKEATELRAAAADHRWRRRARKVRYELEHLRKARRIADMKKSRTKRYGERAKQLAAITDRLGWRQDFQVFVKTANLLPDSLDVLALRKALKTNSSNLSQSEPPPASHN